MTVFRNLSRDLATMAVSLIVGLGLLTGCGSNPPEIDTAEQIKSEPTKPAATPGVVPEAPAAKDAPKG